MLQNRTLLLLLAGGWVGIPMLAGIPFYFADWIGSYALWKTLLEVVSIGLAVSLACIGWPSGKRFAVRPVQLVLAAIFAILIGLPWWLGPAQSSADWLELAMVWVAGTSLLIFAFPLQRLLGLPVTLIYLFFVGYFLLGEWLPDNLSHFYTDPWQDLMGFASWGDLNVLLTMILPMVFVGALMDQLSVKGRLIGRLRRRFGLSALPVQFRRHFWSFFFALSTSVLIYSSFAKTSPAVLGASTAFVMKGLAMGGGLILLIYLCGRFLPRPGSSIAAAIFNILAGGLVLFKAPSSFLVPNLSLITWGWRSRRLHGTEGSPMGWLSAFLLPVSGMLFAFTLYLIAVILIFFSGYVVQLPTLLFYSWGLPWLLALPVVILSRQAGLRWLLTPLAAISCVLFLLLHSWGSNLSPSVYYLYALYGLMPHILLFWIFGPQSFGKEMTVFLCASLLRFLFPATVMVCTYMMTGVIAEITTVTGLDILFADLLDWLPLY